MSKSFDPQETGSATQEQISARAHEIYIRNGMIEGRDLDNWLQAEAELRTEAQRQATAGKSAKAAPTAVAAPASPTRSEPVSPTSVLAETSPIATAARSTTQRKSGKREAAPAR